MVAECFKKPSILSGAALRRVSPQGITNEHDLTGYLRSDFRISKACRGTVDETLFRACVRAGLLSVVYDVLFTKSDEGQTVLRRHGIELLSHEAVGEFFCKVIQIGHLPILKELLSHEAFVGRIPNNRLSAILFFTVINGHVGILRGVLANERLTARIPDAHLGDVLFFTARYGRTESVRELLSHEGLVARISNNQLAGSLFFAARNGHIETLKELASHEGLLTRLSDDQLASVASLEAWSRVI